MPIKLLENPTYRGALIGASVVGLFVVGILVGVLLFGGGSGNGNDSSVQVLDTSRTPTNSPTATPNATPTETPTPTESPAPTTTPAPTPAPTPVPTAPPPPPPTAKPTAIPTPEPTVDPKVAEDQQAIDQWESCVEHWNTGAEVELLIIQTKIIGGDIKYLESQFDSLESYVVSNCNGAGTRLADIDRAESLCFQFQTEATAADLAITLAKITGAGTYFLEFWKDEIDRFLNKANC